MIADGGIEAWLRFGNDKGGIQFAETPAGWDCRAFTVRDEFQRQGIGTALMAAACEWADRNGAVLYSTSFMPTSIGIATRFGFVEDDEGDAHWRQPHATTVHAYLSTACLHGEHEHCRSTVNAAGGEKTPGTCKFCTAVCRCSECDHGGTVTS
jgi:GNAT superfamily N-acetyltransferase